MAKIEKYWTRGKRKKLLTSETQNHMKFDFMQSSQSPKASSLATISKQKVVLPFLLFHAFSSNSSF